MRTMSWKLEREDAETRPCPPPPFGCGVPSGTTCVNLGTGRPLERQPAHPRRRFPPASDQSEADRELALTR